MACTIKSQLKNYFIYITKSQLKNCFTHYYSIYYHVSVFFDNKLVQQSCTHSFLYIIKKL